MEPFSYSPNAILGVVRAIEGLVSLSLITNTTSLLLRV